MLLRFTERGFAVFVLLLSTSPFLALLGRGAAAASEVGEGYPLIQALWLGTYLVVLFLIFIRWKRFLYLVLKDKLLLLLVGIALISVLWSIDPLITLRRSVALVGTTLFGMYLALRYSLEEQLRLLAWALGIAAVLSIIFVVALPSYAFYGGSALQGIYSHKNMLGSSMTLAAVVFLLVALDAPRRRWLSWALFFLSTTLLLLSTAKAPLITFFAVLTLLPLYRALRLPFNIRVPLLIAVILIGTSVATVIVGNVETILTSMGKDATLTGRTVLWHILLEIFVKKQPWLGYGYGAFWAGKAANVWMFLPWDPRHAHNGFLGLMLELGVIGLLVYGISFIALAFNAIGLVKLTKSAVGLWPLAALTYVFFGNLTENAVLAPNRLIWILYVSISLSMAVERVRAKKLATPTQLLT